MLEAEHLIIERAKQGDSSSFGLLYDHYVKPIFRFIAIKVSVREEAEDLTHEVFLSAWQKLPHFESQGFPFSSWLYKIARNRVIDFYRTQKVHDPIQDVENKLLDAASPAPHALDAKISMEKVRAAMAQLKAEHQDVLIFRFIDELSPQEIAHILGKREGAVRIIQHRAIVALRQLLKL